MEANKGWLLKPCVAGVGCKHLHYFVVEPAAPAEGDFSYGLCALPCGHPGPHDTAAPAEGLDVERLARALLAMCQRIDGLTDDEMAGVVAISVPEGTPEWIAAAIAREYAKEPTDE